MLVVHCIKRWKYGKKIDLEGKINKRMDTNQHNYWSIKVYCISIKHPCIHLSHPHRASMKYAYFPRLIKEKENGNIQRLVEIGGIPVEGVRDLTK